MATIRTRQEKIELWEAVKELQFISSFFSWLFMLCSRLAEPCMLLATIYIIIEAGIPSTANPALHNLSVAIMIAAPEIILPGAFVVARVAREKGEEARPLSIICWMFVILTLTTLLSLFIFHFDHTAISVIMFMRCAVGVGYSIMVRILSHSKQVTPGQSQVSQAPTLEITPAHIGMIVEQLRERVEKLTTETINTHLETAVSTLQKTVLETGLQNTKDRLETGLSNEETETGNRQETAVSNVETGRRDRQETGQKTGRPRPANRVETGKRTNKAALVMNNITEITTRQPVSDEEVMATYLRLKEEKGKVSGDMLKAEAKIGKARALEFLRSIEERASA